MAVDNEVTMNDNGHTITISPMGGDAVRIVCLNAGCDFSCWSHFPILARRFAYAHLANPSQPMASAMEYAAFGFRYQHESS